MTLTAFDASWQPVTCRKCKRSWSCTPEDDYYGAESATSGVCLKCLLAERGLDPEAMLVAVIDVTETATEEKEN